MQHDSSIDQSPSDRKEIGATAPVTTPKDELPPDPDDGLTEEERKAIDRRLLWKLDIRLIPWLCLLYLISFLGQYCSMMCFRLTNVDPRSYQYRERKN